MEQDDPNEQTDAAPDEGAAKEIIIVLGRLGQLLYKLRDEKMMDLHHQLANCLSVYLVRKELEAKGW